MQEEMTQQEFLARLVTGAVIESAGIALAALQYTGVLEVTLFRAGLEEVTLLHLGVFLFIVGGGLQLKTLLARAGERRQN